jgi:hypothetical protein
LSDDLLSEIKIRENISAFLEWLNESRLSTCNVQVFKQHFSNYQKWRICFIVLTIQFPVACVQNFPRRSVYVPSLAFYVHFPRLIHLFMFFQSLSPIGCVVWFFCSHAIILFRTTCKKLSEPQHTHLYV